MVKITIDYAGDLHCRAEHGPSGSRLETDAPVDNQGRGAGFSPTDLVATALGTCMLTVMGIRAKTGGYSIDGARCQVEKQMTSAGPRRIQRLDVTLSIPAGTLAADQRRELERAAHTCPVRLSILDAIDVPIDLSFR